MNLQLLNPFESDLPRTFDQWLLYMDTSACANKTTGPIHDEKYIGGKMGGGNAVSADFERTIATQRVTTIAGTRSGRSNDKVYKKGKRRKRSRSIESATATLSSRRSVQDERHSFLSNCCAFNANGAYLAEGYVHSEMHLLIDEVSKSAKLLPLTFRVP